MQPGVVFGPFKVESWVLPTPYYDRSLTFSLDVETLTDRLDKCTAIGKATNQQALDALEVSGKALRLANEQMDLDGQSVSDLTLKVLEAERATAERDQTIARLRAQRNTAWAVTAGVGLAIIGGVAIAIGG